MGAVYSIQYLRFLAAALVVLTHGVMSLNHSLGSRVFGDFPQGGRGVDIFLVISGFIMVYITKNRQMTPLRFAFERLTRIVPLYWIFTMLMMLVVVFVPGLVNAQQLEFWHTLSSYLFIPSPHPDGGELQPLLRVGWTLNIEMLFYLMIVLAMVINYVNWTRIVIVWVGALVILGTVGESSAPAINLWTSGYMLHLINGMLLGRLWEKNSDTVSTGRAEPDRLRFGWAFNSATARSTRRYSRISVGIAVQHGDRSRCSYT